MSQPANPIALKSGEMWGNRDCERHVAGVKFSILDAIDIEIEPHVHEDSHLIFVLSGHYITSAQGAPEVSATPILVDNPSGTQHRDRFLGSNGRFVAINLPVDASREGPATARRDPAAIARMHEITAEIALDDTDFPLQEVALALAGRHVVGEESALRPAWIDTLFEMVMETRADRLSVADLAREADIHPVHVARSFRHHFGRTAGQLMRARQFEQACELLSRGDQGLADIAMELGFCDQPHFSHFFKARAGLSPAAYRETVRQV